MRNIKINSKSLVYLIITLTILILIFFAFGKGDNVVITDTLIPHLSIIAFFIWALCIMNCIINKTSISNLYFLYLLMYGVFIFGYIICKYIFGYIALEAFDLNKYINKEYLAQGIILSIYCLIGLHLGYLISLLIKKQNNQYKKEKKCYDKEISISVIKKMAIILIVISLPFVLVSTINDFKLASIYGYQGVYGSVKVGLASISNKLEPLFFIGMMLLMAGNTKNIKKCKLILAFIIIYNFTLMFLGSRGINILKMLVAIIFYHTKVKKFNYKNILVASILGVILVNSMTMIKSFRKYGLNEWLPNLSKIIKETATENTFLEIINEMGVAIFPTAAAIEYVDDTQEYKYGMTYLYGLTTFIPNISSEVHSAVEKSDTQAMIAKYYGLSFGGSVVQEAYINFGWYSWIFMAMLGYTLSKLSNKILEGHSLIGYTLFCIFMVNFLWTIRNNIMPGLCRDVLWYIVPIYIIYKLIYNGRKKKQSGEIKYINSCL